MSYYKYHVFVCTNQRAAGESCCNNLGGQQMRDYAKKKLKQLNMHGEGQVRVNTAGCLGRCEQGPAMVIYPQETWYTFVDEQDIDEIIESHLMKDKIVERLLID